MATKTSLLHIIELGNYPDLSSIYAQLGIEIHQASSMRKGLAQLGTLNPAILVAEFNYLPTYGTQLSNIEPLLARLQAHHPDTRVILFYEKERLPYVKQLAIQYDIFEILSYPIHEKKLLRTLKLAM